MRAFQRLIEEIDVDSVRTTVDVFLAETVKRLALLQTAVLLTAIASASATKPTRSRAHPATACLRQLAELSMTLEHGAATITPDAYRELLDRIEASFVVGRAEVENALRLAEAADRARLRGTGAGWTPFAACDAIARSRATDSSASRLDSGRNRPRAAGSCTIKLAIDASIDDPAII